MGNTISSISLTLFEIANELFVAAASGILGITILIHHGLANCCFLRTLLITTITVGSLVYVFQINERGEPSKFKVIVITGCDSGLGYSLAHHGCECGFTVFAGFLDAESKGALELERIFGGKIQKFQVDITDGEKVRDAVEDVERFLKNNNKYGNSSVIKSNETEGKLISCSSMGCDQ